MSFGAGKIFSLILILEAVSTVAIFTASADEIDMFERGGQLYYSEHKSPIDTDAAEIKALKALTFHKGALDLSGALEGSPSLLGAVGSNDAKAAELAVKAQAPLPSNPLDDTILDHYVTQKVGGEMLKVPVYVPAHDQAPGPETEVRQE